ncbi:MAG: alcohol dehydrogenase family protein [Hyphomicrobiales bacterium]|nr:alcohol dehydrogenase family protein [Hyphomicrobiales bacterium]MCP5374250.1 alcohol dehydrogenase family protein [Hyphomicrobiales bacterium]
MRAVLLTGHGGFDRLELRDDVPVPRPGPGEVLVRVGAAAVNNTDIKTRVGWYAKSVTTATPGDGALAAPPSPDTAWNGGALSLPRIQGADVAGEVVAVGAGVDPARRGQRVMVEPCLRAPMDWRPFQCLYLGSEVDGGFAEYVAVPAVHAHAVDCGLSDAELASFPCSYSTAENLLTRAAAGAGETVLVTGASGGVGSAAVQLARRRGARVVAVAGTAKAGQVMAAGASQVIPRDGDPVAALGEESVDVVVDLVGGAGWPALLRVLRRGGRYATAGAIAGPMVELDLRTLYLKDLRLFGATVLDPGVFKALVGYVAGGEIKPLVARTYPLEDIVQAQQDFLAKRHTGKLVLIP